MQRETKYKPEFVNEVINLGLAGKSKTQIAAALGVARKTLDNWSKDLEKADFKEALQLALTQAEAYWEDIGQKGTRGLLPKFVPVSWIKIMQARYRGDWLVSDEQKIDITNSVKTMSDKELEDAIKLLSAKKAKIDESKEEVKIEVQ